MRGEICLPGIKEGRHVRVRPGIEELELGQTVTEIEAGDPTYFELIE